MSISRDLIKNYNKLQIFVDSNKETVTYEIEGKYTTKSLNSLPQVARFINGIYHPMLKVEIDKFVIISLEDYLQSIRRKSDGNYWASV